jgi:hydroxymethylglutaryl-CoA lyase
MREKVTINDVGPRDGLQNQPRVLAPVQRLELVQALIAAGLKNIEVGSFVSPRAVPAMAGAHEVVAGLPRVEGSCFSVLIPNLKGYELAVSAGATSVTMVVYGSEGFARKNANMGKREAEDATEEILRRAQEDGIRVAVTISVAFECPFDGPTDPAGVEEVAARFLALGWAAIFMTPAPWVSPMSLPHWNPEYADSTPASADWGAVLSLPGPPAMWQPKTWS